MGQELLLAGLDWGKTNIIDKDFIKSYDKNREIGCFLKVDSKQPEKVVSLSNEFPSRTEKMVVNKF